MKKTLLVLSIVGTSAVAAAQDNMQTTQTGMDDGRIAAMDMNKDMAPQSLPVINTYVPSEVISKMTSTYGEKLYSITQIKSADGAVAYQANLIENGQSRVEWMNESGAAVASVYRTAETDALNAGTNMNNSGSTGNSMNTNSTAAPDPDASSNNAVNSEPATEQPALTDENAQQAPTETTDKKVDETEATTNNVEVNSTGTTNDATNTGTNSPAGTTTSGTVAPTTNTNSNKATGTTTNTSGTTTPTTNTTKENVTTTPKENE